MLQNKEQQQLQIQVSKSLDKLDYFLSCGSISECASAFFYSATLLNNLTKIAQPESVNSHYFIRFKDELSSFVDKDLKNINKSTQNIIDMTLQIVNSNLFVKYLDNSSSKDSENVSHTSSQSVNLATQNYIFHLSQELINQGIKNYKQKSKITKTKSTQANQDKQEINNKQLEERLINLNNAWQQLTTCYYEHRIDEAFTKSQKYIKTFKDEIPFEHQNLLETIQLQYKTMIHFYQQFDKEGWIFDKQDNGIRLDYKMFEKQKQIAIKIQGCFDVPVQNFLSILSEVEYLDRYVPYCANAKLIKTISRNQRVAHSRINIPLLTDRQSYFYCAGYDRIAVSNSIFLYSMTVNDKNYHHKKYGYVVPEKSQLVRLDYKFFIIEYTPITQKSGRLRIANNCDLKLTFLPNFIVSITARRFAFQYFQNILKISNNFEGSPWEEKVKSNPQFYEFFKRKVKQYLAKGFI